MYYKEVMSSKPNKIVKCLIILCLLDTILVNTVWRFIYYSLILFIHLHNYAGLLTQSASVHLTRTIPHFWHAH